MHPETKKQLTVAYFLVAACLLISVPFGFPVAFVLWFNDPMARVLATLFLAAFLPAAVIMLVFGWLLALVLSLALLAVVIVLKILQWIGSISPVGTLVALALACGLVFVLVQAWKESWRSEWKTIESQIIWLCRTLAEFFAWLSYLLFDHSAANPRSPQPSTRRPGRPYIRSWGNVISIIAVEDTMPEENKPPESQEDEGLNPEVVEPNRQTPAPQSSPTTSSVEGYRGWMGEARERFRLRSQQQTLDEQIALRKKGIEWRSQDLNLGKVEADIKHFPTEDRIRGKELQLKEGEVDIRLEEQTQRLQQSRAPKQPEPPVGRRDPIEELRAKFRSRAMSVAALKDEIERLKKGDPDNAPTYEEEGRRLIRDVREQR